MKKIIVGILCCCAMLCGCQKGRVLYRDRQVVMGALVQITSPDERAAKIAFDEMKRIEALFSKDSASSELNRLNQAGRLKVSPDFLYVTRKAREFWILSNGEFDITVGRLMRAWGINDKNYRRPSNEELKSALMLTGMDKVAIDDKNSEVRFTMSGVEIDFGALAKGYAVDSAIKKLKYAGVKSVLINAGGDIYCMGANRNLIWRVAVQDPRGSAKKTTLQLSDKAVATVSDYEQSFSLDNKAYCSIINPKTGMPADSGLSGVSVIANDCLSADASAVSIFLLGRQKGMEFIRKVPGASAAVIDERGAK